MGLSGALHGLLAGGACALIRRRDPLGVWLLALTAAKLVLEARWGPLGLRPEWIGGQVIDVAHRYGAVSGAVPGALLPLPCRRSRRS